MKKLNDIVSKAIITIEEYWAVMLVSLFIMTWFGAYALADAINQIDIDKTIIDHEVSIMDQTDTNYYIYDEPRRLFVVSNQSNEVDTLMNKLGYEKVDTNKYKYNNNSISIETVSNGEYYLLRQID